MRAAAYTGLALGGLWAALATGCISWELPSGSQTVTLYFAYARTGVPLAGATVEIADGSGYDLQDLGRILEEEADRGRLWTPETDSDGRATVQVRLDDGEPLVGPLILRITTDDTATNGADGGESETLAVGLLVGATTIGETFSVTVVDIEITSPGD